MSLALLSMSSLLALSPAMASNVNRVDANERNVTLFFDGVVEGAQTFSLVGPNRIAVDIEGATAGSGGAASGFVRNIRQGQFAPNTARVVFELDRPAKITGGKFNADGRSLKLSLSPIGGGEFSGKPQQNKLNFLPPPAYRAKPPKKYYSVTAPIGTERNDFDLPKVSGPENSNRPLVVIDAGHGGHDPGAISPYGGHREKKLTLALAKAIRDKLLESGRVRVALTREDDRFLVLQERYGIARRLDADLFISVHADAAGSESASGATVYTLSEVASDREASRLAARENKSNIINGINLGETNKDVSSILIDLTQRETMNVSADFAKILQREGQSKIPFRSNSHKFASFVVLKAPDTPSILLESGYLTNESDVRRLTSKLGQNQVASGIARAVEVHFARNLATR